MESRKVFGPANVPESVLHLWLEKVPVHQKQGRGKLKLEVAMMFCIFLGIRTEDQYNKFYASAPGFVQEALYKSIRSYKEKFVSKVLLTLIGITWTKDWTVDEFSLETPAPVVAPLAAEEPEQEASQAEVHTLSLNLHV